VGQSKANGLSPDYWKGFDKGIKIAKSSIEFVRRDGYNDIDYVLEVLEKKIAKAARGGKKWK
jgi:hypothetical protein